MSHVATNWAFEQVQLKPAPWRVLVMLADRHNPDYGCFPSQDRIAADCNMSRSSVNTHLAAIEAAGLIRRVRRHAETTHQRERTRYLFAFESGFVPADSAASDHENEADESGLKPSPESGHGSEKPCPENVESHVQNLDTNPIREPVRESPKSPAGDQVDSIDNSEKETAPEPGLEPDRQLFDEMLSRFPDPAVQDRKKAMQFWCDLDKADRRKARDKADDYVVEVQRATKRKRIPVWKYLADRGFEFAKARPLYLDPFSVPWLKRRQELLRSGPLFSDEVGKMDTFLRSHKTGILAPDGWTEPGEAFEPVKVGSDLWWRWHELFLRRGWPWLPDTGALEFVYFPEHGPDGETGPVDDGDDMEGLEWAK